MSFLHLLYISSLTLVTLYSLTFSFSLCIFFSCPHAPPLLPSHLRRKGNVVTCNQVASPPASWWLVPWAEERDLQVWCLLATGTSKEWSIDNWIKHELAWRGNTHHWLVTAWKQFLLVDTNVLSKLLFNSQVFMSPCWAPLRGFIPSFLTNVLWVFAFLHASCDTPQQKDLIFRSECPGHWTASIGTVVVAVHPKFESYHITDHFHTLKKKSAAC